MGADLYIQKKRESIKRKFPGKMFVHNRWVSGARITETVLPDSKRRFTATIRGFQNWKLGERPPSEKTALKMQKRVREIRDCIDAGDDVILHHNNS